MEETARSTVDDAPRSNQTSGSEQTADAPNFDALARILTDERRRDIVSLLALHGPQTPVELIDRLVDPWPEREEDWKQERTAVFGALHWYLDKHGVVDWDGHDDVIMPGPAFEHAREMLHGLYDGYAEAEARGESP